jgi:hypothetical protein
MDSTWFETDLYTNPPAQDLINISFSDNGIKGWPKVQPLETIKKIAAQGGPNTEQYSELTQAVNCLW